MICDAGWEEFLWERFHETGDWPDILAKKPDLTEYQEQLLNAFFLLAPDRPLGMGAVGCIPTLAILAMADTLGEDRMEFLSLCRELDGVYLDAIKRPAP